MAATPRKNTAIAATSDELPVSAVAFARRGQLLITGGDDGLVRIWDTSTRHELGSFAVISDPGLPRRHPERGRDDGRQPGATTPSSPT
jgi:WD40 repeat protein